MKTFFACLLALSLSGSAFATESVENVKCVSSQIEQFTPNGEPAYSKVASYSELFAVRKMTLVDDTAVYTTNGTFMNLNKEVQSTYSATRTTKTTYNSPTEYMEYSTIERSMDSGHGPAVRKYQTEETYEIQLDGTKKLVKSVVDGKQIELYGTYFSIIDSSGVEYTSYFSDNLEEFNTGTGISKTFQSKSICTITKQ